MKVRTIALAVLLVALFNAPVYAAPSVGSMCFEIGKTTCVVSITGNYILAQCNGAEPAAAWDSRGLPGHNDLSACNTQCQTVAGTQNCIVQQTTGPVPTGSMSISANPAAPKVGDNIVFTSTTSGLQAGAGGHISSHFIQWRVFNGQTLLKDESIQCSTDFTSCHSGARPLSTSGYQAGYEIQYWSIIGKSDGTVIKTNNPNPARVILAAAGSTPPSIATCGNGNIDAGESCDGTNLNQQTCNNVLGTSGLTGTLSCYPSTCTFNVENCYTNGGGSGQITLQSISPQEPKTNSPITLNFQVGNIDNINGLRLQLKFPNGQTQNVAMPWNSFGCPPSCSGTFTTTQPGTYLYDIKPIDRNNRDITGHTVTGNFEVESANQINPNKPYCCVVGNSYTPVAGQSECAGDFRQQQCLQVKTQVCQDKCDVEHYSGGTCRSGVSAAGPGRYANVCDTGETCVCGQIDSTELRLSQSCDQACQTSSNVYGGGGAYYGGIGTPVGAGSTLSFPMGICTDSPQSLQFFAGAAVGVTGTIGSAQTNSQIYPAQPQGPPGSYQCQANEQCWCVRQSISAATGQQQQQVQLPPVIPGTQCSTPHQWCHPTALQDKPTKPQGERACDAAVTATVTASFGTTAGNGTNQARITGIKLIQAGEPVTIVGMVTKVTDQCDGYKYTCSTMRELACEVKNRVAWTTLDYQDCPAGTRELHKEGGGKNANWQFIGSVAAGVVTMGAGTAIGLSASTANAMTTSAFLTAGTAALQGSQCGGHGTTTVGTNMNQLTQLIISERARRAGSAAVTTTRLADGSVLTTTTNALEVSGCLGIACAAAGQSGTITSAGSSGGTAATNAGHAATATSAIAGFATALALSQLPACPDAQEISDCFTVCGNEYTTPASAAPSCQAGGPVIRAEEATYKCGVGECGGFAGKAVRIKVIGPDGVTAKDETTTASASGEFSYTFIAPANDGEFTVIVSVPGAGTVTATNANTGTNTGTNPTTTNPGGTPPVNTNPGGEPDPLPLP